MSCPSNSIRYNSSFCACPPGQLLNQTTKSCALFSSISTITTDNGVDYYAVSFPATILSFNSIKKLTQSQATFLEATLFMVISWLVFCFFLRFVKIGDGRSVGFKIRWWISKLDICFSTRHWLDDQMAVMKRKTELGGTFSIASWILFIGLFAALLYQTISKRTIDVHNIRATNALELASFMNDMEFNITTVSSMTCANLHDIDTAVIGNPGFFYQKVIHLTDFANYSCENRSEGPTIHLKCTSCRLIQENIYISWTFVDLPNSPASAVGYQFNITANNHADKKHVSFVGGTLKNGTTFDDRPVTFRGKNPSILKFNLFPQIHHNLHDLRLMQPLFHEFIPGSFFYETNQLQSSLEKFDDGLLNTTLFVNLLSAYVVEIDSQNLWGPVSFLADLGGLYCISTVIFFCLLVQFESRIKNLRYEDSIMQRVINRTKAQQRWEKLRKYVMYTWGCSIMVDKYNEAQKQPSCGSFMVQSIHKNGSSLKRRQSGRRAGSFKTKDGFPSKKLHKHQACGRNDGEQQSAELGMGDSSQPGLGFPTDDKFLPPPPTLELDNNSEINFSELKTSLESLYEYNVILREKLVSTQSSLHALAMKSSPGKERRS